jgi:superfamily II DNA or RNA helicase
LVYTTSIATAKAQAEAFCAAGYVAKAVTGDMSDRACDMALAAFERGNIQIICACDKISEGMSINTAEVCIMMRKTKSLTVYLQQAGRVMRYVDGKRALILDCVANWAELGAVDDVRHWTLEEKPKTNGKPIVKKCNACHAVCAASCRQCPNCGKAFPMTGKEVHKVTELVEVRAQQLPPPSDVIALAKAAATFAELEAICAQYDCSRGWLFNTALERGITIPIKYRHTAMFYKSQRTGVI